MKIEGNLIDIFKKEIYPAAITINNNGIITSIDRIDKQLDIFISPGLIDAHVHIESSMLIPSEFAKLAVKCGTVATVSDPHEIANVIGKNGVEFMINNGKQTPLKFHFCAPSCVPATGFETSGASLSAQDIDSLFEKQPIVALGEMMNFPGVIYNMPEVIEKLNIARKWQKPIDGHIPGISGDELRKYISEGISTDHECFSLDEAIAKINLGMKIIIREGSSAKNFDALCPLIDTHPDMVMLCTDDSHPDDLINKGHIDKIIRMGLNKGLSIFNLLAASSLNTIQHYGLNVGCLRVGDNADFIVMDNIDTFHVTETYINGKPVYSSGRILFNTPKAVAVNNFAINTPISSNDIVVNAVVESSIRIIDATDGSLLTGTLIEKPLIANNKVVSDISRDILKIVVLNRYSEISPSVGFIHGFSLKQGAIASTVAHDSHNIISIGVSDSDICDAINELIAHKGGITCNDGNKNFYTIPLPFAGLMSDESGDKLALQYGIMNHAVKELGCNLTSPYMTLSFMALLVIPSLKIGDKGLFDISAYSFQDLFV
ncbi:MAG TPA: adenine deaminase [Bacteroidales bacterium]|nr:adenine deaminase [Bacteroidales bacterium]